jgi:hypothetical protein
MRALEGNLNNNVRAAERFLTVTLNLGDVLQTAFPIVGAAALGGAIAEMGGKLIEFFKNIESAPERIAGAFGTMRAQLATSNDELILANDRILAQIATLEHKPYNALKEGLDEARVAADHLSDSLTGSLGALNKMLSDNTRGSFMALLHGNSATDDIRRELGGETGAGGFFARVRGANGDPEKLKALYAGEIQHFQTLTAEAARIVNNPGIASFMGENRLQLLQGVVENLTSEAAGIQPSQDSLSLKAKQDELNAAKAAADKAAELHSRVLDYAKSASDYGLGPVELAIQKRNQMLGQPGLTDSDRSTINEAGAMEIARALAKIQSETAKHIAEVVAGNEGDQQKASAFRAGLFSKELQRNIQTGEQDIRDYDAYLGGLRGADRDALSSNAGIANRAIQRLSIGARPEDALRIADQTLAIRNQEVAAGKAILDADIAAYSTEQQKVELAHLRNQLEEKSFDAAEAHNRAMLEYIARQQEAARNFAGGLYDSLFGGGAGISSFIQQGLKGVGRTIFQNVTQDEMKRLGGSLSITKDPNSWLGKALAGTPFGADKLDTAGDKLIQAAADLSTLATGGSTANGARYGRAVGLPGGISSITSLPGLFGGSSSTLAGAGDWPALTDPMAGIHPDLPARLISNAQKVAAGAGIAAGSFMAINGFRQGGVSGALQGTSGVLGAGSAALSLIPAIASSIPIIGTVAAAVLPLVGEWFGNNRQKRQNEISKELQDSLYHAPTAINMTMDTSGNYVDRDFRGNLRVSQFSARPITANPYTYWQDGTPYEVPGQVISPYSPQSAQAPAPASASGSEVHHHHYNITIQAMDSHSFHDYIDKYQNRRAIGDTVARHLMDGDTHLARRIRYTLGPG